MSGLWSRAGSSRRISGHLHLVSVSTWSLWRCGRGRNRQRALTPEAKWEQSLSCAPAPRAGHRRSQEGSTAEVARESSRPQTGVQGLFLRELLPASLPPRDTQEWFGFSVGRWLWEREERAAGRQRAGPGTSGEGPLGSAALLPLKNTTQPGLCCGSSN